MSTGNTGGSTRFRRRVSDRPAGHALLPLRPSHTEPLQMRGQIAQARQTVNWQEIVDVRECGPNPARQRFVVGRSEERIEPDQTAAAPLQTRDLIAEHSRVAAVPSVSVHNGQRSATETTPAPFILQRMQPL